MAEEALDDEEQDAEDCPKCPPQGAPAWMATFADMATLLMAFSFLFYRLQSLMFQSLNKFRDP
jgi:chemotaxis protein MotB